MDFDAVLAWASQEATLADSSVHGREHWVRVAENAALLARRTPGADETVARLFGLLHDHRRISDGRDPKHGPRGAASILRIRETLLTDLTDGQFALLQAAIRGHNGTPRSEDPTIGVCFDADRLELSRVLIEPDPRFFSTDAGIQELARRHRPA